MPSVVNTNVMSLNAQRQLNKSQLMQNQAMERLSSGLRINSAKDDAAGLGISTGMVSQIKGINQAVRNANDGISMAQTAEGAMDEMTNILQRMRELAVQASNDTNSASNRASIQAEVDQLYSELDRIAGVTAFNGINLLDGSAGTTNFQIGANSGESLGFKIEAVTTKDLNLNANSAVGDLNGGRIHSANTMADSAIAINGIGISAAASNSAITIATAINAKTGLHGVTATAYNTVSGSSGGTGTIGSTITINGDAIAAGATKSEFVDNINRDAAGITATLTGDNEIVLSNDTGADIVIAATTASHLASAGLSAETYRGYLSLSSQSGAEISITANTDVVTAANVSNIRDIGFNESSGSDNVSGGAIVGTSITVTDAIQVNGVELGAVNSGTSSEITAGDIAFAINAISDQTNVIASASTEVKFAVDISLLSAVNSSLMTINNIAVFNTVVVADSNNAKAAIITQAALITAINGAGIQGVTATTDTDTGELVLKSVSGLDIELDGTGVSAFSQGGTALQTTDTTRGEIALEGQNGADVILTSTAAISLQTAALAKLGLSDMGGNEDAVSIGLNVATQAGATNSIERLDDALERISEVRGQLGAVQNRLQSTISNLSNVSQNLSAANSRIRDADFATETSSLSKAQILQQAGTSMLAQANASGQSVLSLLG